MLLSRSPNALRRRAASPRALRELATNGAHLAVLSAFAAAQPLFDLLSRNAEFFVVRGSTRWDVIAFALAVVLVPPAALTLVELLARLADVRLQRGLHLLFVAALAGLFAIQPLNRVGGLSTSALLAAAALAGAAGAAAYGLIRPTRMVLTALTPAPLAFLALFLLGSPVSKLTLPREAHVTVANAAVAAPAAQAPVVMVVFDELPVLSLMGAREEIDRVRYPHFAQLAREGVWFRGATTVATSTTVAVPAILTGMYPRKGALPSFDDHPKNLFTLLGGRYRLNVIESQTHLCPRALCRAGARSGGFTARMSSLYADVKEVYLQLVLPPELAARRPSVTTSWLDFARAADTEAEPADRRAGGRPKQARYRTGRRAEFARFVRSIRAGGRPALNFIHVVLPHGPWEYFPSGTQYPPLVAAVGQPRDGGIWHADALLVRQAQERHLLQVGFVDRLLGSLVRRLRRLGLYERSLIVLTADQGISFRAGDKRRDPTAANLQDIVYVPLLVKLPSQSKGSVEDAHVETVDILPTVAGALGVSIPWRVDGRSALRPRGSALVRLPLDGIAADAARLERRRRAALRRQLRSFGSGERTRFFSAAPHGELLGRRLSTLPVVRSRGASARIEHTTRRLLRSVQPGSGVVPALVGGRIEGAGAGMTVAIALNGRIAAVTRTYSVAGNVRFAALLPESAFRRGANAVQVLAVEAAGGRLRLRSLASR